MFDLARLRSRRASSLASACLGIAAAVAFLVAPAPATAAPAGVRVADNAYEPGTVEVQAGETVTWTWLGENPHSVTSPGNFDSHPECTSLTPDSCGTKGERFVFTPTAAGTIDYRCRIHADMTGTIVVTSAPAPSPTTEPTAAPSPTSTPAPPPPSPSDPPPSPRPSPTASPKPSASPTSSPTPRPGPPTSPSPQPIPTITPTATPSATARPTPPRSFTPFPSAPPSPTESEDPLDDDVVAVDIPGGGSGATPVRIVGATVFGLTVAAFGRFVLFAPPWDR